MKLATIVLGVLSGWVVSSLMWKWLRYEVRKEPWMSDPPELSQVGRLVLLPANVIVKVIAGATWGIATVVWRIWSGLMYVEDSTESSEGDTN